MSGVSLKQVEQFKYLGVVFTSDGRQAEELDTRMGKASVLCELDAMQCDSMLCRCFAMRYFAMFYDRVMRALQYSVVMKRKLSKKAKLSVFTTVFVPILWS